MCGFAASKPSPMPRRIGGIVEVRRFGGADDPAADAGAGQPIGHRPCPAGDRAGRNLARSSAGRARAHAAFHGRVRARGPGSDDRPSRTPRRRWLRPPAGSAHRPSARSSRHTATRRDSTRSEPELSAETGLPYLQAAAGEQVAGTYRQSLTLTSGRFAMIDNGLGFQLVPWSPPLEKQLGRHVSGVMKDGGGIEWGFGRKRELGL